VLTEVRGELLVGLPNLPAGWEIAAIGVGPDGRVLILAAEGSLVARRATGSSRYRIYAQDGELREGPEFLGLRGATYDHVQPIDGHNFLVAAPWTYPEMGQNGHVLDRDGTLVRQLSLGEGIADVQTTSGSDVWVSYFDEGVFKAGEPGLACFDHVGERVFAFNSSIANNDDVPIIHDCYAMNVESDNEVWLYYYSAFPLVRLVDKQLAGIWPRTPGLGAHAFAVGERSVLFAGDYGDTTTITRHFPESGRAEMARAIGQGQAVEFTRAAGRGDSLYLLTNTAIWLVHAD
jgi:hypothetical protein